MHGITAPLPRAFGASFIKNPFFKYPFFITSFLIILKATENIISKKISLLRWISFLSFMFSALFLEEYE